MYVHLHTHTGPRTCACRGTCMSVQGHTHTSQIKPVTEAQGHRSLGHTKALQHRRAEWSRACRCAQRVTHLCTPACDTHTQAQRRSSNLGKITCTRAFPSRTGGRPGWLCTGWQCSRPCQAQASPTRAPGPGKPSTALSRVRGALNGPHAHRLAEAGCTRQPASQLLPLLK